MSYNPHRECDPDNGIHADIARRAAEREHARCIKVLQDLRDGFHTHVVWFAGFDSAIAALSAAAPPVGGGQ
jgi:hypothetical protein